MIFQEFRKFIRKKPGIFRDRKSETEIEINHKSLAPLFSLSYTVTTAVAATLCSKALCTAITSPWSYTRGWQHKLLKLGGGGQKSVVHYSATSVCPLLATLPRVFFVRGEPLGPLQPSIVIHRNNAARLLVHACPSAPKAAVHALHSIGVLSVARL